MSFRVTAGAYIAAGKAYSLLRRIWPAAPRVTVADILARRRDGRRDLLFSLPSHTATAHDALRVMIGEGVTSVVLFDEERQREEGCASATSGPALDSSGTSSPKGGPSPPPPPPLFRPPLLLRTDPLPSHLAVAIVTQNDYLRKVALSERVGTKVLAREIGTPFPWAAASTTPTPTKNACSAHLAWAFPTNTVESALEMMAAMNCHHLPIFSAEEVGIGVGMGGGGVEEPPSPSSVLRAVVSLEELLGLTRELREKRAASYFKIHGVQQQQPSLAGR